MRKPVARLGFAAGGAAVLALMVFSQRVGPIVLVGALWLAAASSAYRAATDPRRRRVELLAVLPVYASLGVLLVWQRSHVAPLSPALWAAWLAAAVVWRLAGEWWLGGERHPPLWLAPAAVVAVPMAALLAGGHPEQAARALPALATLAVAVAFGATLGRRTPRRSP